MEICRIGINQDRWWSLYWTPLLQQHCNNTKTRMHKSQNIGNTIALRTAKLLSREVMRQVRRGFFGDLDFRWVRVYSARSSSHWPKRTSISGTWKMHGGWNTGYQFLRGNLQAQKDRVIRHSDALVDPDGSPGTFQNSTWIEIFEYFSKGWFLCPHRMSFWW